MHGATRIFLIGPMGAGKTTIGRRLAQNLKKRFLDCDQELEGRTGARVALIFDIEGEAGFREREKRLLDELTQIDDIVLATGGGVVLDSENRRLLAERGFVVYLRATLDKLIDRTRLDTSRPLLQTEDPRKKLEEILEFRDPLYRKTADLIVDTADRTLPEIVKQIRSKLPA
jgi:shikimate kinase